MNEEISAGIKDVEKIQTHFAKVIVEKLPGEILYYGIMWYDNESDDYKVGFSSYNPYFVFKWLEENFEMMECPPIPGVPEGVGI